MAASNDAPGTGAAAESQRLLIDGSMLHLLGPDDRFLRTIEQQYPSVSVHVRGNEITLTGLTVERDAVRRLIAELQHSIADGHQLDEAEVRSSARMLQADSTVSPSDLLGPDILTTRGKGIRPKTRGQKQYSDAIDANTVVFGIGPAGTGKTYIAMAKAVRALQNKTVDRIILTRPAVEAGERLGFLPGSLTDKIDPYLRPLYDALGEMLEPDLLPKLLAAGTIEVAPLAYMRGRTLNRSFVVLDEAQNTTPEQMKMFLTRLGFGSKMVVTGDVTQIDLPAGTSGLKLVSRVLGSVPDIHFAHLSSSDVVRHSLVGRIVDAYTEYDTEKQALHQEGIEAREFAKRAAPRGPSSRVRLPKRSSS